ncbi:hypothetical protein ABW16_01945 [Mycolicibacter heraklionensis]|uniref:Uncharacterized protein n=1 Tax=Mycolicibacter heraklionensis TaxID=512402 RepID=A0ABR5FKR7_9MYCO|nr:hypothetical protein [Mycolicibacter heraklionensis]KLO31612.1 hypothetical protein ABW16_01945 [Mycolicibacter heraklionensis]
MKKQFHQVLESLIAQQKRCRALPDDHKPHHCARCRRHIRHAKLRTISQRRQDGAARNAA